jgi:hypothetical protein
MSNLQILQAFSVKHLRALCIQYGISASGTKKILVERLQSFTQTLHPSLEIPDTNNIQPLLGTNNTQTQINNQNNNQDEYDPFLEQVYLQSLKTQEEEEAKRKDEIMQQNMNRKNEIIQQNMEYEESLRMDTVKEVTEKLMTGVYEDLEKKQIEIFLISIQIEFPSDMEREELLSLVPENYITKNIVQSNYEEYTKEGNSSKKEESKVESKVEEESLSIDELRQARLKYYL